jgi:lactoylglutathione lyase
MYLSYVGIRVTDLDRSLHFYCRLLGLEVVVRGDNKKIGGGVYVLLRDKKSKAKLELNWYPPSSPFASKYVPGEGLDHISFRVESVAEAMAKLKAWGATDVELPEPLQKLAYEGANGGKFHMGYVKDPDGNWIELYDYLGGGKTIPKGY